MNFLTVITTKAMDNKVDLLVEEVYLDERSKGNIVAATNLGSLCYKGIIGVRDYVKVIKYEKLQNQLPDYKWTK